MSLDRLAQVLDFSKNYEAKVACDAYYISGKSDNKKHFLELSWDQVLRYYQTHLKMQL